VIRDKGKPGKTYLAQDSVVSIKRLAVKQLRVARKSLTANLQRTSHGNVVNLLAAFVDGNVVSLAYEVMDITLGELRRQTELEEKYISYISREAGAIVWIV
jgi:serine/threonine protein kinase